MDRGWSPIMLKFQKAARLVCSERMTQGVLDILERRGLLVLRWDERNWAPYEFSAFRDVIEQHKDSSTQENLDFIRWLLNKGVFNDVYEKFYDKPLHHAAATCNANVASMLLKEFDADINEINGFG
ncbi:hypothetical protein BJX65DRAFT_307891 [Aspergillus insuetus]